MLFVHGIGQQGRGETLIQCADPIQAYLDALPGLEGGVDLEGARLRPDDGPPHVRLRFRADPAAGPPGHQTWLLAESWWADAFVPARFGAMCAWAARVVPWAVLSHLGANVRAAWRRLGASAGLPARAIRGVQLAGAVALLTVAPQLALLTQLLLLALAVLAVVPIAGLRAPARWLSQGLAATLGDSFILLSSETNRAAMVERIRGDVRWLAARARRVVVVAHSQGGALAWEAVLDRVPPNLSTLLTYGSGLRKLLNLRIVTGGRRSALELGWTATLAQLAAFAALWWMVRRPAGDWRDLLPMALTMAAVFVGSLVPPSLVPDRREAPRLPGERALGAVCPALAALVVFFWQVSPRWPTFVAAVLGVIPAVTGVLTVRRLWRRFPSRQERAVTVAFALGPLPPLAALCLLHPDGTFWQGLVTLLVAVALVALALVEAVTEDRIEWATVADMVRRRRIAWRDWHASRDPVPEGPIEALGGASIEVTNRGSMLADHTAYWRNRDEFVGDLVASLAGAAGWTLPAVSTAARRRRAWRVGFLGLSTWLAWLAVAGGVVVRLDAIRAGGRQGLEVLGRLAATLPYGLGESLAPPADRLGDTEHLAAGVVALVLAVWLLRRLFVWGWSRWDARESALAIRGAAFAPEKDPSFLWPVACYLAGLLGLALPTWLWLAVLPFLLVGVGQLGPAVARRAPPAPVPRDDRPAH